jgi:hypothetical protein
MQQQDADIERAPPSEEALHLAAVSIARSSPHNPFVRRIGIIGR